MINTNNLKFLQINIKSLKANLDELKSFIIKEEIDICLISETWLKDNEPKIKNFSLVTNNRDDGYGGVAVLINNKIEYKSDKIPNLKVIETATIETLNTTEHFTVISTYIPPISNKVSNQAVLLDLITIFKFCKNRKNVIFGGDMNAHNPLWGKHDKSCKRGKDLEDLYEKSNLMILNKHEITFTPPPPRNPSTIDLRFVSCELYTKVVWEVLDENLGSDHLAIIWSFPNQKKNTFQKRNVKIDYITFTSKVTLEKPSTVNDLEDFNNMMKEAAESSIIGSKNKYVRSSRVPKSWWSEAIEIQRLAKKEAMSAYHKIARRATVPNLDQENERKIAYLHFKKQMAILKRLIVKEKKASWIKFVETISPNTSSAIMWKQIKKLEGKNSGFNNAIREDFEKAKSSWISILKKNTMMIWINISLQTTFTTNGHWILI